MLKRRTGFEIEILSQSEKLDVKLKLQVKIQFTVHSLFSVLSIYFYVIYGKALLEYTFP